LKQFSHAKSSSYTSGVVRNQHWLSSALFDTGQAFADQRRENR